MEMHQYINGCTYSTWKRLRKSKYWHYLQILNHLTKCFPKYVPQNSSLSRYLWKKSKHQITVGNNNSISNACPCILAYGSSKKVHNKENCLICINSLFSKSIWPGKRKLFSSKYLSISHETNVLWNTFWTSWYKPVMKHNNTQHLQLKLEHLDLGW